ncbi:MAG: hypothetical protein H7Y02_04825 [Candidatus Obscuribacterales bacterium]|nr:hypothetical protein [Steroidobacteraceae bacterium]
METSRAILAGRVRGVVFVEDSTFQILSALRRELTWSHYKPLIHVENEAARSYYAAESADQNWSTRALERQINMRDDLERERALVVRELSVQYRVSAVWPSEKITSSTI